MVRTRFAPSPTGYLHIGGVRTALFNWLFARHHGGQFILRIDDTDQQRNVDEALQPILDGFRWLGLQWDEGPEVGGPCAPYFQSQRSERHREAVEQLLRDGFAYRDYATPEELQQQRDEAQHQQRTLPYDRRWMAETTQDQARFEAEGRKAVVRLKMFREGTCRFHDLIRGQVQVEWQREQDHVIQRADGSCLYHLASTVDDRDFDITHVIRAEEHLSNTPRQIFIAQALGFELPEYAHLPVVAEPGSRNKLSKRKLTKYLKYPDFKDIYDHGQKFVAAMARQVTAETFNPVIVDFYRQVGYLPDAIINYLLLLGWSLDDKTEEFTRDQMIEHFTLERVNKAPASFDIKKLWAFQDRHMRQLPVAEKAAFVLPYLQEAELVATPPADGEQQKLLRVLQAAGERVRVAGDILDHAEFFLTEDQLTYDEKVFAKRLGKPEAADLLSKFKTRLADVEPFDSATLEEAMRMFVESEGIKIGQIIHAVRVAVTGKSVGFGMFDCLAILGRRASIARIDRALARL